MYIVTTFVAIGLILGLVARLLVPGSLRRGWIASELIGAYGALVGGFLGRLLGLRADRPLVLFAIMGATALLVLYHVVTAPRRFV